MSSRRSRSGGIVTGKHIQAIIKVGAKLAVRDLLREVSIGRGHQANIHMDGARAAQPFEFVLLQNPQELGLQFERNIADLVEKQRAAMGQLEAADALRNGAGERALFMAEQFAL